MIIFCFDHGKECRGFIRWEASEEELAKTVADWIISNCTDNGLYGIDNRPSVITWSDKWSAGQKVRYFLLTQRDMKNFMIRWHDYIHQPNWHDWTSEYKPRDKKTLWEKFISLVRVT